MDNTKDPNNLAQVKQIQPAEPVSVMPDSAGDPEPVSNPPIQDATTIKPPITMNIHYILFILLFVVLAGCFSMMKPYIHAILLAIILSFVVHPVHVKIEKAVRDRKNLAAFITCFLLTILVVIPLTLVLIALIHQGVTSFNAMYDWIAQGKYKVLIDHPTVTGLFSWLDTTLPDIQKVFPTLDLQQVQLDKVVMKATSELGKKLLNQSGHIVGNVGVLIANFFLMIVVFFFVIRDQKALLDRFLHLFPLSHTQEEQIMTKIKEVSKSALLGTLATSLSQGIAGGIVFAICGFPGLFWGSMMVFASLIPVVGVALIWVPACLLLLATGKLFLAITMLVCFILIGFLDNVLRPLFMQGGAQMNTLLIFLSILGGLSQFGLIGLLYGPLLFALALVLIYIYNIEFKDFLSKQDNL